MQSNRRNRFDTPPDPWLVLAAVALGLFMVVIDVTILNIALPSIQSEFHASTAAVEWILIGYTLTLTGLVPVFGRISDVIGRKRLFIAGVAIFGLASLLAFFSTSIVWLIGARLLQAFGGALITTNTLAIITDVFPAGKRGAAMGVQAILISGGAAIGPTLGGFLVTHFGWPSVFLVNVPISAIAATIAIIVLPPLKTHRTLEPVDWPGAGLILIGLGALLLGITKGSEWGWDSPAVLGLIAAGLILVILFIFREGRAKAALVDLSLFRIREFTAGQTAGLFTTMALASVMLLFPFYWQSLRGYSAQSAGLLMLPIPATLMLVAPFAGRLSDSIGSRGVASAGLCFVMASLFLISGITATMPVWEVITRLGVLGIGVGLFMAPNNNAVMSSVPPHHRGVASGLLGMFRYTGQSLGISFAGAVFASFARTPTFALHGLPSGNTVSRLQQHAISRQAFQQAFSNGLHAAALFALPLAGIAFALSLLRGKMNKILSR